MTEVLTLALTFPSVVYTVLLGVVLVYWLFVMLGAVHIGEGSEGALDGLDAGDATAGAVKGALEGATHAAIGHDGAVDGLVDGDADLDVSGSDGTHPTLLAAVVSALRLRQIPATAVLSILITFSWLISVVAMQILSRNFPNIASGVSRLGILLIAPVLALPLSSMVCIPLSRVFVIRKPPSKQDLIGSTCRIRTGSVTQRFGEATLEDGGAGLVVRVRVDRDRGLKRGDQALIIQWDPELDSFLVEPMAALLDRPSHRS